MLIWSSESDAALLETIQNCSSLGEVCEAMERIHGYEVTRSSIRSRLRRLGKRASDLLSTESTAYVSESSRKHSDDDEDVSYDVELDHYDDSCDESDTADNQRDISRLLNYTTKKAISFEAIHNKLGIKEERLRKLVTEAASKGYDVRIIDNSYVTSRSPRIGERGLIPHLGKVKPGRYRVAIATDIHFGSTHCDTKALKQFFNWAHSKGCEVGVCTGDILDGNKDVLLYEQDRVGFDRQVEQAVETWKDCPIKNWVAIDGNHDGYYSSSMGTVSGRLLAHEMKAAGINWNFLGVCLGRAVIHGAKWQLWHPHGGSGTRNAVRRILNDRIEDMEEGCDILAMGHFHKYTSVHAYPEPTFGVAGGTFQRKASEFANRIAKSWDIGGCIVSYLLDENGTISEVASEFWEAPHRH